jgi:hypothetical protein
LSEARVWRGRAIGQIRGGEVSNRVATAARTDATVERKCTRRMSHERAATDDRCIVNVSGARGGGKKAEARREREREREREC